MAQKSLKYAPNKLLKYLRNNIYKINYRHFYYKILHTVYLTNIKTEVIRI